jgi:Flp pilus assembly CpaE family ATPase
MSPTGRPCIAVLLPASEQAPVIDELRAGGFETVTVADTRDLEALIASRRDVAVAIVDVENDFDGGTATWSLLHSGGRSIPSLLVINPATFDRMDTSAPGHEDDESLPRPYSAESVRWRVEAMVIRGSAVDDGSGPVLQGAIDANGWNRRGQLVAVFNPKGGVGKTTIAVNLAAALAAKGQTVLLVDADTVTGHVPTSLGMDGAATVVDAWRDELDGGPILSFEELASTHTSGFRVLPLSASPIHTEVLDPERVADGLAAARRSADWVIVDLHPSYSPLNRSILDRADRILVPVTPDLPAIRATVKLRDVADELGMRERLALVVNRSGSGVGVADIEKAIGIPVYAEIRSGGLLMVKAVNEGHTLIEIAPKEKITGDFSDLADRLTGTEQQVKKSAFRLFGRAATARA